MSFRCALVTGGGSGLGRAFALELADRGAAVCVTDVREDTARATAEEATRRGVPALGLACDVRSAAAVEDAVRAAERALGPLDLCVNNAGVMVGGDLGEIPLDDWRLAIDVNLWGNIHGVHACAPRFKERGRGHFLNVASIAGVLAAPETGPYSVTKAGILSLTETTYAELGKWGVGATALCPSAVRTGIFDAMRSSNPLHKKLAEKNAALAGPREPEAIARIALDACERGELYVFPQPDAKAIWLAKRLMPGVFSRLARTARTRRWLERTVEG
jgi:NAD(P)-dependent dehydrogenase (short-subunit alcohol dehydrogenase family)